MSIALDLALQLTLGAAVTAPAATPPPGGAVRAAHRLVWGTTEVSARNTTGWGFGSGGTWNHRTGWAIARARAWRHSISWSLPLARQQTWAWGLRLDSGIRLPYADLRRHQMRLGASYGERPMLRAQGVLPFGDLTLRRRQFQSPWSRQRRGGRRPSTALCLDRERRRGVPTGVRGDRRQSAPAPPEFAVGHAGG